MEDIDIMLGQNLKLKLISDFREPFYDHWFDLEGKEFRRVTTDGLDRPEMIDLFRKTGLKTPKFGKYEDFLEMNYSDNKYVIVYTDIRKHCGEGKNRKLFGKLEGGEKNYYLMEYVDTWDDDYFGRSTRYLFIGNEYCFKYEYGSRDDWRSNCGDLEITIPKQIDILKWRDGISYPLFAIDFVDNKKELLAIDLNCAPGISDLFKGILKPSDIVKAIKNWYKDG